MKLLAGILAFVILTLSVQPAFASFTDTEEVECRSECCQHENSKTGEEQPDEGCSDFCNPLLKCGTSAISTMDFLHFTIDSPAEFIRPPAVFTQPFHSQFNPDFWQPPKLA